MKTFEVLNIDGQVVETREAGSYQQAIEEFMRDYNSNRYLLREKKDFRDFMQMKADVEEGIRNCLTTYLQQFEDATGLTVTDIDIDFINSSLRDNVNRGAEMISDVKLKLDLTDD
jgi:hypothetical protein